jgi:hypothetical protein
MLFLKRIKTQGYNRASSNQQVAMSDKQVQFLPFSAVNLYMRNDYRADVVKTALQSIQSAPKNAQHTFDGLTKKWVVVPGFRNSVQAPLGLKIKSFITAFEKSPDVAGFVLKLWADLNVELRTQVFDLLTERKWELIPADADRTRLPGFLPSWPEGEDFDILNTAFNEKYPGVNAKTDDVSLMVVWLSGRLPYQ